MKSAFQIFFENLFNTPEITFYFREHKEVDKLTEKFSKENYTNTETDWINLLIEEYRKEIINKLITVLVEYIFIEGKSNE